MGRTDCVPESATLPVPVLKTAEVAPELVQVKIELPPVKTEVGSATRVQTGDEIGVLTFTVSEQVAVPPEPVTVMV